MVWRHLGRSCNSLFLHHRTLLLPPMANAATTSSATAIRRLTSLIRHLRFHTSPPSPHDREPRKAAVLVCLFEGRSGDLRVVLTKRSPRLSTHSGEVSLPGGKAEEGDDDDGATALREAREEIGLEPSLVTVVGVMEPILSKMLLLRVVPVIGILADREAFKPSANSEEVEAIFDAPLEMFLKDENRISTEREWRGMKYILHHFTYESDKGKFTIWGLTAAILIRAASVVYQRPPSFVEQI